MFSSLPSSLPFPMSSAHFDTIIGISLPRPLSKNNFSKQRTVKFRFRSPLGSPPDSTPLLEKTPLGSPPEAPDSSSPDSSPLLEKNESSILRLPLLPCDIQVLLISYEDDDHNDKDKDDVNNDYRGDDYGDDHRDAKSGQHGQRACAIFYPSCANFWPVNAQNLLSLNI